MFLGLVILATVAIIFYLVCFPRLKRDAKGKGEDQPSWESYNDVKKQRLETALYQPIVKQKLKPTAKFTIAQKSKKPSAQASDSAHFPLEYGDSQMAHAWVDPTPTTMEEQLNGKGGSFGGAGASGGWDPPAEPASAGQGYSAPDTSSSSDSSSGSTE